MTATHKLQGEKYLQSLVTSYNTASRTNKEESADTNIRTQGSKCRKPPGATSSRFTSLKVRSSSTRHCHDCFFSKQIAQRLIVSAEFGTNFATWFARPRNLRTALTSYRTGISKIAVIFSGSAWTPCRSMT